MSSEARSARFDVKLTIVGQGGDSYEKTISTEAPVSLAGDSVCDVLRYLLESDSMARMIRDASDCVRSAVKDEQV